MSDYRQERRADQAAEAEQRRIDAAAAEERRVVRQRAADERAARLREQQSAERAAAQRARADARSDRSAARGAALTAGNVYRKGTLALVTASALGSLPAQVLHFVHISPMLLPLPFAIEGAAWVMAAGVAYADERGLPGWVRWLLRGLVGVAAGFAASVNYSYGTGLDGLSPSDAATAGIGLAAVTLLGPVLFEVRQWVSTLSAKAGEGDQRQQRRHDRRRRRHHKTVARLADRLTSAAPLGSLPAEDAWARAWSIVHGTDEPGMTPQLHRYAVRSTTALTDAMREPTPAAPARTGIARRVADWLMHRQPIPTTNSHKMIAIGINQSMSDLGESTPEPAAAPAPVGLPDPTPVDASAPVVPVGSPPVLASVAAESPRPRRATGRVPDAARTPRTKRTPDQLLTEARELTADWSDRALTADAIRKAVHTSAEKARGLRDTLRAERATGADGAGVAA
ncbi:hypothetical protein [Streptomyces sp. NBC_01506]|uniref:hypothetical protein n=1 Tax=Streptomyces sp. NBC_01506 TaxID=2903887 RepID=UPI00386D8E75